MKGTKFNRILFQLQPKMHRTDEIGVGLLPTPTVGIVTGGQNPEKGGQMGLGYMSRKGMLPTPQAMLLKTPCTADAYTENMSKKDQKFGNSGTLAQEVQTGFIYQRGMLPTPTAMDSTNATATMKSTQVKEGSMHSVTLNRAMSMGMLPTPTAQIIKHSHKKEYWDKRIKDGRQEHLSMVIHGHNGMNSQLNPRFVAEMMGFPPNWTELPFQSGEQKVSKDTETQ
jgi:hypothetical protein